MAARVLVAKVLIIIKDHSIVLILIITKYFMDIFRSFGVFVDAV